MVHLSGALPVHKEQPSGQATMEAVSRKNPSAELRQSANVLPKHKAQFAKQGLIALIAVLVAEAAYFPHKFIGTQLANVPESQVHFAVS